MDEKQIIKKILGEIDFILEVYENEPDITEYWEKTIMKKLRKIRKLLEDNGINYDTFEDDDTSPKSNEAYATVVDYILATYDHEMNTTEEEWKNFPPPAWSYKNDLDIEENLKELKRILKNPTYWG